MEFRLFLIVVLSHIIFDFVFQGNFILDNRFPLCKSKGQDLKKKSIHIKMLRGNLIHSLLHFIGLYIISITISTLSGQVEIIPINQSVLILIIHFVIDEVKSLAYLYRTNLKENIWIFLMDQIMHLFSIIVITFKFKLHKFINITTNKCLNYPREFDNIEKILIILGIIFTVTWVTGVFIKIFIKNINSYKFPICNPTNNDNCIMDKNGKNIIDYSSEAKHGGFIIGLLERIFILISIIINNPTMIGFVLTAKSIARLKKLSNDSFAEYFIIGTLLSFISAIIGALIIRSLII